MLKSCPKCGRTKIVKRGLSSNGKQRYRCSFCLKTFSDGTYQKSQKEAACQLSKSKKTVRQIAGLLSIPSSTIQRWIKK